MHNDAMLGLLGADGPHPAHRAKLMLFGKFVGSWELDMLAYQQDGPPGASPASGTSAGFWRDAGSRTC